MKVLRTISILSAAVGAAFSLWRLYHAWSAAQETHSD